jgi:hypothetical protein
MVELRSRLALKQRPQSVPNDSIKRISRSRIADLPEQKFPAPIAVGIYRIDEFIARLHVKVIVVGGVAKHFVQVAVNILPRDHDRAEL